MSLKLKDSNISISVGTQPHICKKGLLTATIRASVQIASSEISVTMPLGKYVKYASENEFLDSNDMKELYTRAVDELGNEATKALTSLLDLSSKVSSKNTLQEYMKKYNKA